jgi:predicted nucleotidyltransferase
MIDLIEQNRAALADLCRKFKVQRLDVFGSATSNQFDPARSDIDFLYTLQPVGPGKYADNFFGLADALESLLCQRVDLVCDKYVRNPYFRQSIEESRQPLYDAETDLNPNAFPPDSLLHLHTDAINREEKALNKVSSLDVRDGVPN